MPGSHRWGLVDAARGEDMNVRTDEEIEQRGTPVALEMAAGDVLYLTNLTFHTSKMNRTEDSRWSVDFRFHVTATALDGPQRDAMEEIRQAPAVRRSGAAPGAQRIRRSFLGRVAGRDAATAAHGTHGTHRSPPAARHDAPPHGRGDTCERGAGCRGRHGESPGIALAAPALRATASRIRTAGLPDRARCAAGVGTGCARRRVRGRLPGTARRPRDCSQRGAAQSDSPVGHRLREFAHAGLR